MEAREFSLWLDGLSRLTLEQRAVVAMRLQETPPEPALNPLDQIAARRIAHCGCPHCGSHSLVRWGRANGSPRWRCSECKRTFNGLTNTPIARLRKKERWFDQARAMIDGMSLENAAALCGVHATTAFRWRHRFLRAPAADKPQAFSGSIEATVLFLRESYKGSPDEIPKRDWIPILFARDMTGATTDAVLTKISFSQIRDALQAAMTGDNCLILCDDLLAYQSTPTDLGALPPGVRANNALGYRGRFQKWMRRFHGVATKNLPQYLGWRRALEGWGETLDEANWLLSALDCGTYQQLTQ